jgi:hypothetical protein
MMGFAKAQAILQADLCLTGKSPFSCPALVAKIFLFSSDPNHRHISGRPASSEGRFAIVTDVERGMRWTRMAL